MPRMICFAATVAASALSVGAALAADPIKVADERVAQTRSLVKQAQASGDAASLADAQAKYEAAQAQAWGARHPARAPAPGADNVTAASR